MQRAAVVIATPSRSNRRVASRLAGRLHIILDLASVRRSTPPESGPIHTRQMHTTLHAHLFVIEIVIVKEKLRTALLDVLV